jgi:hypothetical protein
MLTRLATFLHAHGRPVLLAALISAAIAPKQSSHTQERTT